MENSGSILYYLSLLLPPHIPSQSLSPSTVSLSFSPPLPNLGPVTMRDLLPYLSRHLPLSLSLSLSFPNLGHIALSLYYSITIVLSPHLSLYLSPLPNLGPVTMTNISCC